MASLFWTGMEPWQEVAVKVWLGVCVCVLRDVVVNFLHCAGIGLEDPGGSFLFHSVVAIG